jgi:hypothetical protein
MEGQPEFQSSPHADSSPSSAPPSPDPPSSSASSPPSPPKPVRLLDTLWCAVGDIQTRVRLAQRKREHDPEAEQRLADCAGQLRAVEAQIEFCEATEERHMLALFAQRLLHEARAALASPVPPASPAQQPPTEPEPILPLEPFRDPPTPQRPTGPSPRTLSDLDYAVQAVRVAVSQVHTEALPPAERLRELQQCKGRLANLLIRLEELASSPSMGGLGPRLSFGSKARPSWG